MMKKYFAMTIIAASVSLAACSDDDDDDDMAPQAPAPEVPAAPAATPGVGGTAFDTIVNSDSHQMLEDAIISANLADTLDNPESQFTIFAPTDAAFSALTETPDAATLARILSYHVISGTVDSTAVGTLITDAGGEAVAVNTILVDGEGDAAVTQTVEVATSDSAASGVSVNDVDVTMVDVTILGAEEAAETAPVGLVHVIDSLLMPPAAPEVQEPDPEEMEPTGPGTEGPVASGAADEALAALGTSEIFRSALARDFGGSLDAQAWTFFVPSDAALTAAGLSDLTAAQQQAHIVSAGANDPAALGAMATILASNNVSYAVTNTDGNITVDGKAVELVATGAAGAQVYSIDGVLGN